MPRAKSIVMTKAEKKTLTAELKAKVKAAQADLKILVAKAKEAEKSVNGFIKANTKEQAVVQKALDAAQKQLAAVIA